MPEETERVITALNKYVGNTSDFPLSLSMVRKKVKKDTKFDNAVSFIRKTVKLKGLVSTQVYVGNYDDRVVS